MICPRRAELGVFGDHPFNVPVEDTWREDGTCSWCGSMKPEDLFTVIERGEMITPTDKNYKIYVNLNRKFYFQHFSEEDMKKFVDLINAKKIALAYPGHFYVLPYFCQRKSIFSK